MAKDLTFIAQTNFRNAEQKFGIKRADRRQHMYVVGKTGVGKTGFLKNMALQDIENGQGLAIIDPHGEFVEEILESIPPHRMNDVVYFNPADMQFPVSFNIMEASDPKYKHLIASGLIGIFTKIWANVWSARMEYILANCILALLDTPGTTLLGIPRMLVDRDYRQKIINNLKDPVVKSFWVNEYEEWEPRYRNEAIAPVQNKVGQFLNVSFVRNIVGQGKNTVDIEEIMNNQKILLVNVSKGRIGEDNAAILGAMIITKIQLSAMERVRIPEDERKDFYLYVDEFQNFATDSFVNILSEARKYRLNLIIAHQYIGQLVTDSSTAVRDAVFGNVGTMVSFRVGAADAEFLEQEFTPEFLQNDLIRLDNRNIYIKLMIDGITSRAFSGRTINLVPIPKDDKKREEIIRISRSKYAHTVQEVEDGINRWAANKMVDISVPVRNSSEQSQNIKPGAINKDRPKPQQNNGHPQGHLQQDGTTLYDVKCSNCGKDTKVIFEPTSGKPVYCKSCLKKLKAGEIAPVVSSADSSVHTVKPTAPIQKSPNTPAQANRPEHSEKRSAGNAALEMLGIEFGAPPSMHKEPEKAKELPRSLDNIIKTGEHVPFNKKKDNKEKKPVDLGELRKTLDQALHKEGGQNPPQTSSSEDEKNP
jgi:CxxC-x17-CxxC domain-containing protein